MDLRELHTIVKSSSKYELPEVSLVDRLEAHTLSLFEIEVEKVVEAGRTNGAVNNYSDSWVLDLTTVDEKKLDFKKWVGSASCRADSNAPLRNRFQVKRYSEPMLNDISYSVLKDWVPKVSFLDYMKGFGQLRKVSIAALDPEGWWPAHYDFSNKNGYKLNLCISSNPDCKTVVFNSRRRKFEVVNMEPGGIYFVNVGMKHFACNWGKTSRVHVLCTYAHGDSQ